MYENHKLLVANRGEIAVRILRTARELGIPTVALYTPSDATAPHVTLADQAVALTVDPDQSESSAYISSSGAANILEICKSYSVTLVHPGYGFLSENAEFARMVVESDAGITWLGPRPDVIHDMGIKHLARKIAVEAGIPVVPGSEGCLESVDEALAIAKQIGYPMIIKATAGGGGMGMVACNNEGELREKLGSTMDRAKTLFGDARVFLERYFPAARHIEVQVFGNGQGKVIHLGERECSVQRRHQKVLEESPSPFCLAHPGLKDRVCAAAIRLCESIKYGSAGTVEFIVDENTAEFFFLEMNTRIQVEHPVTEEVHPGLDLIKMMIDQGIADRNGEVLSLDYLQEPGLDKHAIEVRVYSENPFEDFKPSPGILQLVDLECGSLSWLRVDGWVSGGTTITPFFDPLMCKLVVSGSSRGEALERLEEVLEKVKIQGPPNNLEFLRALVHDEAFRSGKANTRFLDSFKFVPRSFTVLSGGLESTVQDYPGRLIGLGIPRSGPMDSLAFRVANTLVGNPHTTEAIEFIVVQNVDFELVFHSTAVVAITGKEVDLRIDGMPVETWSRVIVPSGGKLLVQAPSVTGALSPGLRNYLAIRGGFPGIPQYLGSKSTSMGLGGYQGRSLLPGDEIALGDSRPVGAEENEALSVPRRLIPVYPFEWVVHVLDGPHDDEEFVTSKGMHEFYSTSWKVSASSNRMGIRLEGLEGIKWARKNGGEGGSHPSNILDNGYALGSLNINGDTPVILTNEGPDMGGYVCFCTVVQADMWKLGQLSPGQRIKFKRISWHQARSLSKKCETWLSNIAQNVDDLEQILQKEDLDETPLDPKLRIIPPISGSDSPRAIFRQAGEGAILIEYGPMTLDFNLRARIHVLESLMKERNDLDLRFCPCIRSTMCHFDPSVVSQDDVLNALIDANNALPSNMAEMEFPGRRITFPIVLDDKWSREAIARYMKSTRSEAAYLPSNVEYLAKNNGLAGVHEALSKLVGSDWFVFGVGFYLACPFLVPIDPRCRLVGQKMNPSRTYTPRGAIGIAGVVAAIYPVESPGGYQLYGRTLPAWQTWGRGGSFSESRPWLLQPFDQVHFEPISEEEYVQLEKDFDGGRHTFATEPVVFSMNDYTSFVKSIEREIVAFKEHQAAAVAIEEQREEGLLKKWLSEKRSAENHKEVDETNDGSVSIFSPLMASVWKIPFSKGDTIQSSDDVLLILEAMKTEIPIKAGARNVGRTVIALGKGIREGTLVQPGDTLLLLS